METYRMSMAIWLSLFLYLLEQSRTSNAGVQRNSKNGVENILLEEIVLARRNNTTKLLGAAAIENPIKANERILSLINGKSDLVFPNYDPVHDQSIVQSQAMIVSLNDTKDLENLDHVLAFTGYESQKVNVKKDKRKVLDNFNNDQATSSSKIKITDSTTVLPYVKTHYDVTRRLQSNRRNSNEGHYLPVMASYHKVSKPITRTDPNIIVVNTETSSKKFAVKNHPLPKVYKPEEELTLSSIELTKPTYRIPTRKMKNDETKIKKSIEENVSVRPKLQRIKKKVKIWNVSTSPPITVPSSVYNYTVLNGMINNHKSLLESPIVQPVASPKINNIVYQNDSLANDDQPDLKRQESNSDSEFGLSKNYNVIPRPFTYSTKHSGNVKEVQATTMNAVTPKNIIETKESLVGSDSNVNPVSKQRENREKYQSNIDDTLSSRLNLMSEESIDSDDNIGISNKRPQRRNDSYEVSESTSLEDDSDSDNADSDRNKSYEFPETSKEEDGYYDSYDDKNVHHSQDLKHHKGDRDYETSNLKKADRDSNYEEAEREDQDHVSEEYRVKNNDQGDDQDEGGAHNYKHIEKSESSDGGDGGDGGGGGGGDDGGEKEFTKGSEAEQKEGYYKKQGNKKEKAYKIWHEHDKAEKGHHDKEQHNKEYEEKGGEKKEHGEDGEYYQDHYQDEKGEKEAEFNEKGEHKKGHNTKGEHLIHKKDEYEKKTEFFDEFHEDGDSEKDGEYYSEHEAEKGGKMKSGRYDKDFKEDKYGNSKKYEESEYHDEEKGKGSKEGQESHYDHEKKYKEKGAHVRGKKWMMDSGDGGDGKNAGDGGGGNEKGVGDDKRGH